MKFEIIFSLQQSSTQTGLVIFVKKNFALISVICCLTATVAFFWHYITFAYLKVTSELNISNREMSWENEHGRQK